MPYLRTYYLFIAHAWHQHNGDYKHLVALLNSANNFQWVDYSVPQHDPKDANSAQALRQALQDQIRPVQCVLVISGIYVAYRDWMQYEISLAANWGKPIIGIKPWGRQNLPRYVTQVANKVVGWNTDSIVSAIRNHVP